MFSYGWSQIAGRFPICYRSTNMICLPMMWYGLVISSFENLFWLTWRMLTHIQDCKESLSSLDDLWFLSRDITTMPDSMLLCRSAWLWLSLLSKLVAPSLLLAFTCTKRTDCLCIQNPLNQLCHMSPPYLPIHGIYPPFLTKTFVYHLEIFK